MYKGDRSIYSNFFPAPFKLGGDDYLHVEQYYQYVKATHHGENEVAERIMKLSNPWRIKVLGDSIEPKDSWLPKRMKTLYEGVSAKFRQNWPLHDELLRSKGLKLYEATTDPYFACGIGFDSKKWSTMEWNGENVAGLVVMKVRDELLLELSGNPSVDNTLTQIASGHDDTQMETGEDHELCPLESTHIHPRKNQSGRSQMSHNSVSSQPASYRDAVTSPSRYADDYPHLASHNRGQRARRGHNARGRAPTIPSQPNLSYRRGNDGRGMRRPHRGNYRGYSRRHQDIMSQDDRNFLFGYQQTSGTDPEGYITPSLRKTAKSPISGKQKTVNEYNENNERSNDMNLTKHQMQGLVELGLIPNSDFVKNIVSQSRKTATA